MRYFALLISQMGPGCVKTRRESGHSRTSQSGHKPTFDCLIRFIAFTGQARTQRPRLCVLSIIKTRAAFGKGRATRDALEKILCNQGQSSMPPLVRTGFVKSILGTGFAGF
jgi:hypothetical protein